VLLEKGTAVARLVPDKEFVCIGRELAEALADVELSEKAALRWRRDLPFSREALKPPTDKWR
jgi:hypothetical protein